MDQLEQNVLELRRRLDEAAGGRPYTLLAASKTQPAELINRLPALGIYDYGENRVQEWVEKSEKIDEKLEKRLKDYSQKVYEKLGLFGPVRIDFIREGSKIYINELNTIPGSLGYYFFVPYTFKTMGEYVDAILLNGKKRFEKEQNFKKEFITKLI